MGDDKMTNALIKARKKKMPLGNIFWKNIPKDSKIEDMGSYYVYKNKVVNWTSQDARQAQAWLRGKSK